MLFYQFWGRQAPQNIACNAILLMLRSSSTSKRCVQCYFVDFEVVKHLKTLRTIIFYWFWGRRAPQNTAYKAIFLILRSSSTSKHGVQCYFIDFEESFCHFWGLSIVKIVLLGSPTRGPRGPPKGARDAPRPKVAKTQKENKNRTRRQRTFFLQIFRGSRRDPPGEPLLSLLQYFYSQNYYTGSLFVTLRPFYSKSDVLEAFLSLWRPFYSQKRQKILEIWMGSMKKLDDWMGSMKKLSDFVTLAAFL